MRNLAAKALADRKHQQRICRDRKRYNRKLKHKSNVLISSEAE